MSPRIKEKKDATTWTKMESSQLVASIKVQLKKHDPLPYSKRVSALNWEEITIPHKSVKECKGHLGALIKKIHRIRTLGEILSDVDVEPVDVVCEKAGVEMTKSDTDSGPIDNNKNSPAIRCLNRKSKRSSEVNKRPDSETTQDRSQLNPFTLFAKQNQSRQADNDSMKERYDKLPDGEKLFWIKKAVAAASEDEEVQIILTGNEFALLNKERKEKSQSIDSVKQNNATDKRKRKVDENDDGTRFVNKKARKIDESSVDRSTDEMVKESELTGPKSAQDVMVSNDWVHYANAADQIFSAADIEMETTGTDDEAAEQLVQTGNETYDLVPETEKIAQLSCISSNAHNSLADMDLVSGTMESDEELEIVSTQGPPSFSGITSGTMEVTEHCETSEEESKIEEVEELKSGNVVKEESTKPPRVFSRIRDIWSGWFGRFGNWGGKQE